MQTADIEEMFQALGEVSVRRLFGGKGVYHRGLIVAVEFNGELQLKADQISGPEFEAAGAVRWTYEGRRGKPRGASKPVQMSYWSIPDDAYDDPELMAHWVRLAYAAASRLDQASPNVRSSARDSP